MTISNDLIDADVVWPSAGGRANAGGGIDVAIIDSGIDEDHPASACKDVITHKVYAATASPVSISPVIASFGGWNGHKAANADVTLTLSSLTGAASTCSVSVTGPAGHPVTVSSTTVTVPATGTTTLTLSLSGGKSSTTVSGDIEGDVVLTCAGTELKVPWWLRIDRQGKP
jgi:hypothetical protein